MNTITLKSRSTVRNLITGSLAAIGMASTLLFVKVGVAAAAEAPQVAVSYADLDLARSSDVQLLYRRLQRAASHVCGDVGSDEGLARYAAFERCYVTALEHAVMQVDAPKLVALYRAQNGAQSGRG